MSQRDEEEIYVRYQTASGPDYLPVIIVFCVFALIGLATSAFAAFFALGWLIRLVGSLL